MESRQQTGLLRSIPFVSAALFCALLVFFAVGAKLAWYTPVHSARHNLASTKIWFTDASVPAQPAENQRQSQPAAVLPALLLLLGCPLVRAARPALPEIAATPPDILVGPPLSVRPPPAL